MKELLLTTAIKLIPKPLIYRIEKRWRDKYNQTNRSVSQNGEDLILQRLFSDRKTGFYVDIGAHHPIRFSNTYNLYLKGWRGINIDAMPGSMDLFKKLRPDDINLEIGVSSDEKLLDFYIFNEPALNTFDQEEAKRKDGVRGYHIVQTVQVRTMPLAMILANHVPVQARIDYLNIDVEGLDVEVLKSNDWRLYNPDAISVELNFKGGRVTDNEIYDILRGKGYNLVSVLYNTLIFLKDGIGTSSPICI